ncbi:Golgi-associated plant pathogenesis-related protein 1-like [Ptychodera flava]|uniref:Golgi-associated plant pathogenesis-related protein 1-like n=1 Tax=Ptychodera flava TaxID=63121 RepID=UPI00396A692E
MHRLVAAVLIVFLAGKSVAEDFGTGPIGKISKREKGKGIIYGEDECAYIHPGHPWQCEDRSGFCMSEDLMCDGFIVCDTADDENQDCGWGETDANGCTKPDTIGNSGLEDLTQQILEAQNYFRCLHGVQPLKWDDELARAAKLVALDNAARFEIHHSTMKYGENIDFIGLSGAEGQTGYGFALHWYREISLYRWASPGFQDLAGHFTQLVWADTDTVGCAFATSRTLGPFTYYFAVCEYWPPGNVMTAEEYQKNVLPPL